MLFQSNATFPRCTFDSQLAGAIGQVVWLRSDGEVESRIKISDQTREEIKRGGVQHFVAELARRLLCPDYRPAPLGLVALPKTSGGNRFITAGSDRDRIGQRAIYNRIVEHVDGALSFSSSGFRPHRSAYDTVGGLKVAMAEARFDNLILIDIKRCFPSIPIDPVLDIMRGLIGDGDILRLLEVSYRARPPHALIDKVRRRLLRDGVATRDDLIYLKRLHQDRVGVPEGSPLSPLACNLYLKDLVEGLKAAFPGACIYHYADNLAVLMMGDQLAAVAQLLEMYAARLRIEPIIEDAVRREDGRTGSFLGYRLGWKRGSPHLNAPNGKAATASERTRQVLEAAKDEKDLLERFGESVLSILAYYRHGGFEQWALAIRQGCGGDTARAEALTILAERFHRDGRLELYGTGIPSADWATVDHATIGWRQ